MAPSGSFPTEADANKNRMDKGLAVSGEMAERLNAAVLKTAERDERSVSSNLTLS